MEGVWNGYGTGMERVWNGYGATCLQTRSSYGVPPELTEAKKTSKTRARTLNKLPTLSCCSSLFLFSHPVEPNAFSLASAMRIRRSWYGSDKQEIWLSPGKEILKAVTRHPEIRMLPERPVKRRLWVRMMQHLSPAVLLKIFKTRAIRIPGFEFWHAVRIILPVTEINLNRTNYEQDCLSISNCRYRHHGLL